MLRGRWQGHVGKPAPAWGRQDTLALQSSVPSRVEPNLPEAPAAEVRFNAPLRAEPYQNYLKLSVSSSSPYDALPVPERLCSETPGRKPPRHTGRVAEAHPPKRN